MSLLQRIISFLLLLTAVTTTGGFSKSATSSEEEAFDACMKNALVVSEVFCLPSDYRKDVPPPMDGPIQVYFKIPVSEISKIDDQRSQISIRWTYKLKWPEPRMILNTSADWSAGEINVRGDMVDHFWTPDIIIHDLVSFFKPEILNAVAALEIKKKKQLYYKVRSDMTMVCKGMKFTRFPLDSHTCYLRLTSFGYDDRRMVLDGEFTYEFWNQRALPFNVQILEISDEMKVYAGSTSNYSVYGLEIRLARCVSPYLLNVYLPTAIFVVMSWVSFLIPTDVVPARIVLLVTLCLVIINTFNNVTPTNEDGSYTDIQTAEHHKSKARIPVASAVTALEIWLLACILLVFGALAEYAFILRQVINLTRKHRKLRQRMHEQGQQLMTSSPPAVFAPGASLTSNSLGGGGGRNGQGSGGGQASGGGKPSAEEWHSMRNFNSTATTTAAPLPTNNQPVETAVTSTHPRHHHHHHHFAANHPQVSLETYQTERGGANTTIAATTHHLHECEDETLSLTHRSVGICTTSRSAPKHANRNNHRSAASGDASRNSENPSHREKMAKTHEQLLRRYQEHVDGKALIVFPIAFFLFNIGYWCHYLLN